MSNTPYTPIELKVTISIDSPPMMDGKVTISTLVENIGFEFVDFIETKSFNLESTEKMINKHKDSLITLINSKFDDAITNL